jgi:hypothetical protein
MPEEISISPQRPGWPVKVKLYAFSLLILTFPTSEKDKMLSWLRIHLPDPSKTHNRLLEEHHEGTGEWFLKSEIMEKWKKTPCGMLWIKGIRMFSSIS